MFSLEQPRVGHEQTPRELEDAAAKEPCDSCGNVDVVIFKQCSQLRSEYSTSGCKNSSTIASGSNYKFHVASDEHRLRGCTISTTNENKEDFNS